NPQRDNYPLQHNTIFYNPPFTLTHCNHQQTFKFNKNPTYSDKDTLKLQQINFNLLKQKSTQLNLFDSKQLHPIELTSHFLHEYKKHPNFKQPPNLRLQFLPINQQNKLLQNLSPPQAIHQTIHTKSFLNTLLNHGST
ncbi:ABC transporter substrate-binding protein, partial [Bacillus thuringiensis]|uniref:ABC transporter substrate-binding protein n=1 Tax=Bacillus thuringiensis TaxID=1428 RepID=UPI0021B56508